MQTPRTLCVAATANTKTKTIKIDQAQARMELLERFSLQFLM